MLPVEEPEGRKTLVGSVTVESEVDVGGDRLIVVHAQHSLQDECRLVLVAEGLDRCVGDILNTSQLPRKH